MAYTKFGEFMRVQRIKHHEVMGDTARLLDVSIPFVSDVENGKKNIPLEWIDKIANHYCLTEQEREELSCVIEESKTQMKLSLVDKPTYKRMAALQFQRSFDDLDEETARKIMQILTKEDK